MSEELNRKLAEWAGWERVDFPDGSCAFYTPEGTYLYDTDLDFTSSLDVCFKWLGPPLLKDGWQITIHIDRDGVCVHIQKPRVGNYSSEGTELAPALCNAIEQLIEEAEDESR